MYLIQIKNKKKINFSRRSAISIPLIPPLPTRGGRLPGALQLRGGRATQLSVADACLTQAKKQLHHGRISRLLDVVETSFKDQNLF